MRLNANTIANKKRAALTARFQSIFVIIIDEMYSAKAEDLARQEERVKELLQREGLHGGIHCVWGGDPTQLGSGACAVCPQS